MKFSSFVALCASLLFAAGLRAADPANETIIECMGPSETVGTDTEVTLTFHDKVVVTGNNLKMHCDLLVVVAFKKGDPAATIGKYGNFKSLVATGHVRILQGEREVTCGRAEIFPGEEKITLTENYDGNRPRLRNYDDQSVAEGYGFVLYRGQRRAVILQDPAGVDSTRITLPVLKDLGYDKDKARSPAPSSNDSGPKIVPTLPK